MKYNKKVFKIVLLCLIFLEIILFASYFLTKNNPWFYSAIAILVLIIMILLNNFVNLFFQGISGEDDIGDELKKLPNDFVVIHQGLDTNKGNIDKIVVGPTGVFTIEVKSHKARVTFNGEELLNYFRPFEKDFLKQAYAEAIFLREHLKNNLNLEIEVQPVLVFSSQKAMMRFGFQKIKGAYVIQKRWLNKLITQPNSNFLSEEVKGKIVSLLQA